MSDKLFRAWPAICYGSAALLFLIYMAVDAFRGGLSWNWILVRLGLRPDYSKVENSPPAFEPVSPHVYRDELPRQVLDPLTLKWVPVIGKSAVCVQCGGGKNHKIHSLSPVSNTEEKASQE